MLYANIRDSWMCGPGAALDLRPPPDLRGLRSGPLRQRLLGGARNQSVKRYLQNEYIFSDRRSGA